MNTLIRLVLGAALLLSPSVASAAECSDDAVAAYLETLAPADLDDYADAAWACEETGEPTVWAAAALVHMHRELTAALGFGGSL